MLEDVSSRPPLWAKEVLEQVFPAGSRGKGRQLPIHVIRQGAEPRWIIVGAPRKALLVLRSWAPWKAASRIRWNVVRGAAAVNMLSGLPGVANTSSVVDPEYWSEHIPALPDEWSAVVHVGNPSHTRKAIVFLVDGGRRVICAGKVPLMQESAAAIVNEAAVLEVLRRFENVPKILFCDQERGVAAQSWLAGEPVSRLFTASHVELLSSLALPDGSVRVCDCRREIARGFESADFPYDRSVLSRGLDLLDYDKPLRAFIEHRDFAPWNLKWIRKGVLGLVDWEWAETRGFPWQDIARYFFLNDVHFKGSGQVWEELKSNELLLRYQRQFEIPDDATAPLTMRYLLRELLMEWEGGNGWLAEYAFLQIKELTERVSPARG